MTKVRVYEVAREVGLQNRELVQKIASMGIPVRNHMSALDPAEVERVKRALDREKQDNVVEERIRPTVVRRRVTRKPEVVAAAAAAAELAAAQAAPAPERAPVREAPKPRVKRARLRSRSTRPQRSQRSPRRPWPRRPSLLRRPPCRSASSRPP